MIYRNNSTIGIKNKTCIVCGRSDQPWFSKKRCKSCTTIQETQAKMEAATEQMIKEEDLSDIIKDLDAVFSQYIRLKYIKPNGLLNCFTCTLEKHWSLHQCGHYIKRQHLYLRWDERNCKPQCVTCNEFSDGNIPAFTRELEKESPGLTTILQEEMNLIHKPTKTELKQLIAEYAAKVKQLKKKLQ